MSNPVGWSSIYPPQYMSNQDPNVSPVASRALMSDVQKLGLLGRRGPVTGADLPAVEARGQGLMDNAMTVAGAVNPVGIRAFHGSPHTFDRFDMSKLGTGEGAQAYGHGLYFAGAEDVARSYKTAGPASDKMFAEINDKMSRLAKEISANSYGYNNFKDKVLGAAQRAEYDALMEARTKLGSMYEVNLRTSPERLLDWDKPLSAQPQGVRDALAQRSDLMPKVIPDPTGATIIKKIEALITPNIHDGAVKVPGYANTSEPLRRAGIDGIQYLDGGSRAAGEGSRNYVMFDDKLVEILRRYGLLGMLGGGAAGGGLLAQEPAQ